MDRLKHKVAIVTGAAQGIGRAIAELFAEEGARVFIADLDEAAGQEAAAKLRTLGSDTTFFRCDVSVNEQVTRFVKAAVQQTGRLDILVNNAAYMSPDWHDAAKAPDVEWEKCFRVTLMGAQYFTREMIPVMVQQKGGSIINVSSVQGLVAGGNSAAYTTIKHGLIGLTRSIAFDYGMHNIRCNAICPGAITTRISPPAESELYQRQVSKTFLGRVGTPREVAQSALFLASDESSYVTGAVLAVDGGWTAM